MSRESPGAQSVPSGVVIQKPQQSSGWKMRSAAPGTSFCQEWVGGGHLDLDLADGEAVADVVAGRGKASAPIRVST